MFSYCLQKKKVLVWPALEAMACQVPVISSNAGGIPELNIHGVTGFMSEIGDIDDMVTNTLTVLQDDNLPTFKANATC